MSHDTAPILRAFAAGKRKQDARKSRQTTEDRLKWERYQQECAGREKLWAEQAREQKLKDNEKFARRVARKKRHRNSVEVISWDSIEVIEPRVQTPQIQGELRVTVDGQNSLQIEMPTLTETSEETSKTKPRRPKKKKSILMKKTLLEHYCKLQRNKRKAPLRNTICYGEQLKPPIYVTDSTLHSWIQNPNNGVNKSTWRVEEAVSLPSTKAGRRPVMDEETLNSLQDAIIRVRMDIGARISIPMTQKIIIKLLQDSNKGHLVGDGPGQLKISRTWTQNFLTSRMKWSYRAVTSCTKYLPKDWKEQQKDFVLQVALLVRHHNLAEVDVYNIDETNMLYNPAGRAKTWNPSGKIDGTDDYYSCEAYDHDSKQMITIVCAITASGERLPLQYIFEGKQYKEKKNKRTDKMERRLDEYGSPIPQFGSCPMECKPPGASFAQTSNHWANADTTLAFFDELVIKHADRRPDTSKPILVIWDNAKFHCTEEFRGRLKSKYGDKIILCYLPTNTTSKLQPLDVSVNGAFKQAAKKRFFEIAAEKCVEQLNEGNNAYHDLHKNVSKISSTKLVEITQTAWDRLQSSVVIRGWEKSGMMQIFDTSVQNEAFEMSIHGELVIKCLGTRWCKDYGFESNHRLVLDVFADEDHLVHDWDDSLCDNDEVLDNDVDEEEIANILMRIMIIHTSAKTTSREDGKSCSEGHIQGSARPESQIH